MATNDVKADDKADGSVDSKDDVEIPVKVKKEATSVAVEGCLKKPRRYLTGFLPLN
jgi:hypothetical protein